VTRILRTYTLLAERPEDIGPALGRAIDSGRPACINVMLDPEVGLAV